MVSSWEILNAVAAEKAVLCCMLIDRNTIPKVLGQLSKDDFSKDTHRAIYGAIRECYAKTKDIETIILHDYLIKNEVEDAKECALDLMEIEGYLYNSVSVDVFCDIVMETAQKTRLLSAYNKLEDAEVSNLSSILSEIDRATSEVRGGKKEERTNEVIGRLITKELIDIQDGKSLGLPFSGIPELDELTNNCKPGELILIAARPSMGKSMLAMTITSHASKCGSRVVFWGLEMTNEENAKRFMSCSYDLDFGQLMRGELNVLSREYETAIIGLEKSSVKFIDTTGVNVLDIKIKIQELKQSGGVDMVVIDHGGLLDHDLYQTNNQVQAIGDTSKALKNMAKELNIVVVLVWQLNRGVESRNNREPFLSDLRGSGRLEEDSDKVLMIDWAGYWDDFEDAFEGVAQDDARIFVRKNRNGRVGYVKVKRNTDNQRFQTDTLDIF